MVGVARFELSEADLEGVERETLKKSITMPHTQNSNSAPSVDSLRKQLTEADRKRRQLLAELFCQYPHDTAPIIKTLIFEASASTLQKVEVMLSIDLHKEAVS